MRRFLRVLCVVGRHDWKTEMDAAGAVTFCTRCGKLVHGRGVEHSPLGDPLGVSEDKSGLTPRLVSKDPPVKTIEGIPVAEPPRARPEEAPPAD